MDATALFWHVLNFLAPALALALAVPLVDRYCLRKKPFALSMKAMIAINFIACTLTLVFSLWWQGFDGAMRGYLMLVLASALTQALLSWRR